MNKQTEMTITVLAALFLLTAVVTSSSSSLSLC